MVSSQTTTISYTSDGVAKTYSIPYYFFAVTDIIVQGVLGGVVTTYALTTDYIISGTVDDYGAYNGGGTLSWVAGHVPANGTVMTFTRSTARLQPDAYVDNSAFPAAVNEADLDRLTLITQEIAAVGAGFLGLLAGPPTSGSFVVGQWFITTPPVPAGYFGYICTTAGAPGTWKGFGLIAV